MREAGTTTVIMAEKDTESQDGGRAAKRQRHLFSEGRALAIAAFVSEAFANGVEAPDKPPKEWGDPPDFKNLEDPRVQRELSRLGNATYVDNAGKWTDGAENDSGIQAVFKRLLAEVDDPELVFGDEDAVLPNTKDAPDLDANNPDHQVAAMKVMLAHASDNDWTAAVVEALEDCFVFE